MTSPRESILIREAKWPGDLQPARSLLRNYEQHLRGGAAPISIEGYDRELDTLPQHWAGPNAALLLAWRQDQAVGCVAVRLLAHRPGACELKRMWVEPAGRRIGLGRRLVQAVLVWSREHGAKELLLDTAPDAMPEAQRLYASMGFAPILRYNTNPVPGIAFLRLPLE